MKYIALTIGPIYKTLSGAKKPKELFSASYFFSYLMREIIKEFKHREFVVPYVTEAILDNEGDVGLFHDRFIFKAEEGDLQKLENDVIPSVIGEAAQKLDLEDDYLKKYLQIHYGEYDVPDNENAVFTITPYLDTAELFYQVPENGENKLQKALRNKENFLLQEKKIVDDLKKLTYNKYFAVVHADGDKMADVIRDSTDLKKVSQNLFEYCMTSHEKIKSFGGQTIFAGGDDLLFFAPVVDASQERTIFDLCEEIAADFEEKMDHKATLSFGVSITYVKFPLYEALEKSRELLSEKAKTGKKNNIAFEVIKHSGQTFGQVVSKYNKELYSQFLALTSNIKGGEDVQNFLHSLHHKLDNYKAILSQIAHDKKKLKHFFDNYFSGEEHKMYKAFFDAIISYIQAVYDNKHLNENERWKLIYGALRFVKFIQGDRK